MRNLAPAFVRYPSRNSAADANDLLTIHGTRLEHHRPPRRKVESVRTGAALCDIPEAQTSASQPVPLRAAVPFVVVRGGGAEFLPRLSDLRDVGGARNEDVAIGFRHGFPLVAPDLSEVRFRHVVDGLPIHVPGVAAAP